MRLRGERRRLRIRRRAAFGCEIKRGAFAVSEVFGQCRKLGWCDNERCGWIMSGVACHEKRAVILRRKRDTVEDFVVWIGEQRIVRLCNYENVRLWNCGIVVFASRCYDACSKNARQFLGFVYKVIKFAHGNISRFTYNLEPYSAFGKFLHCNFEFVYKVLAGFSLSRLGVIGCNTCGRAKQLICKTVAANLLCWQRTADVYTTGCELHDTGFKFILRHILPLRQIHNSTISQFHYSTIPQSVSSVLCGSASSGMFFPVPILNGILPSRRHAFAKTTNAVDIDIPMSLQNCEKSLLRSSSMRMLNATCAISDSPLHRNAHIVPYSAPIRNGGALI